MSLETNDREDRTPDKSRKQERRREERHNRRRLICVAWWNLPGCRRSSLNGRQKRNGQLHISILQTITLQAKDKAASHPARGLELTRWIRHRAPVSRVLPTGRRLPRHQAEPRHHHLRSADHRGQSEENEQAQPELPPPTECPSPVPRRTARAPSAGQIR